MANRLDALQSLRRSQCSSASVRTSWLCCPNAIQCLTSIRVTAATVRTMCDPIRTMSSIRQVVHSMLNRPDVSFHGLDDQASNMEITCTSSTFRTSAFRSRRSKPYYGNYVQLKYNLPDARAIPSERGLVMEDFSAILKGECS